MSDTLKVALISAGNTFLAVFVSSLGASLMSGGIQWSLAFWGAVVVAAVRVAVKAVINTFVPVRLGGRKA